jgi:VWFA-related protein
MNRFLLAGAGLAATMIGSATVPSAARQSVVATRTVYVTAVDARGRAVTDLSPADLRVRDDGRARDIVSVVLAREPLAVAFLVDDNGYGLAAIRQGLGDVLRRLAGSTQFSITSTAGRNVRLLDYTSDASAVRAAITRLYARNQRGGAMLDGLLEAGTDIRRREFARSAIVAITTESEEFSNVGVDEVLGAVQRSHAAVYLVNLGAPAIGAMPARPQGDSLLDEATRRNAVFGVAPARSGGRAEQVLSNTGIPRVMAAMAEELASQYAVTYRVPVDAAGEARFNVESARKDVKVRGPQRVGSR